jgi:hypothetical protein
MNPEALKLLALDQNASLPERVQAIEMIAADDLESALEVSIQIACDETEHDEMLRLAGRWIGILSDRWRQPTEFELRDVSKVAYDSYCEHS